MNNERKLNTNEKIENTIGIFKDIISCLEDIKETPEDGRGKSMNQICLDHNINYLNLRKFMSLKVLENIYQDDIIDLKDIELPIEDPFDSLYKTIFGIKEEVKFPIDYKETLDFILTTSLNNREQLVIDHRFGFNNNDKKTLDETGELLGVKRERIRQIEAKAIRKLRNPKVTKILRVGLMKYNADQQLEELEKLQLKKEFENNYNKQLEEMKRDKNPTDQTEISDLLLLNYILVEAENINIGDLDMLVRTYNGIKRAGIKNLEDLLLKTDEDIMKIRNIGKRSFEELDNIIINFLNKFEIDKKQFRILLTKYRTDNM